MGLAAQVRMEDFVFWDFVIFNIYWAEEKDEESSQQGQFPNSDYIDSNTF